MPISAQSYSLYVHIPWCVRKCPYCDFNSHQLDVNADEEGYLAHLMNDLSQDIKLVSERTLSTIFIGGGTPSVFTPGFYEKLLASIRQLCECEANLEITMEANPGTLDSVNFAGYRNAGINRLSIGAQSFDDNTLQLIGRIHDNQQIIRAFEKARQAGFDNINLDLMFALPAQDVPAAMRDLQIAIDLQPEHLSWYQLTLEPNTPFHHAPPPQMPDDDLSWEIQESGQKKLAENGYQQYEISAYSRAGRQCRHNLNYWRFGDYLGIGAGAHGKITDKSGSVCRITKKRGPANYMNECYLSQKNRLTEQDLYIEYFLNRFRLKESFDLLEAATVLNLSVKALKNRLQPVADRGLLSLQSEQIQVTDTGHQFLNETLGMLI